MPEDLSSILTMLNNGQNPTPGYGSGDGTISSQRGDGTISKDFGLHSVNESAGYKDTP